MWRQPNIKTPAIFWKKKAVEVFQVWVPKFQLSFLQMNFRFEKEQKIYTAILGMDVQVGSSV